MNKMQIENCLKIEFQLPQKSAGTRKIYLLPYVGNMTKGKIDLFARRLKDQLLKDGWEDYGESMVDAVRSRLESPRFTGKEKKASNCGAQQLRKC